LQETKDCDPHCGSNGKCSAGRCECNDGWIGQSCESKLINVTAPDAISDSVAPNGWVYYRVFNSTASVVNVFLSETNKQVRDGPQSKALEMIDINVPITKGVLKMFLATGAIPTNRDYTETDARQFHIVNPSRDPYDYFIGVYATVNGPSMTQAVPYQFAGLFYSLFPARLPSLTYFF